MTAGQRFFTCLGITLLISILLMINNLIENIQLEKAFEGDDATEPIIYFLPTQGLIHTAPGQEVAVMIFGAADNDSPIFGEQNQTAAVRIDNENLNVVESTIDSGKEYKGMSLFSICLEVSANEPGNQIIWQVILLNEKGEEMYFDIGHIVIDTSEPNEGEAIDLRRHTGGSDLQSPYNFVIKNKSTKACIINDIDFDILSPYLSGVEILVDGKKVENGKEILLRTEQHLELSAKFKGYTNNKVFLISPTVIYHLEGEQTQHAYSLPPGIVGIPDSDSIEKIYEKYFQN